MDLIVETGDALTVTDFKTARSAWSEEHVAESASQLLLYSELAKDLSDGKPLRLGFAVLTKTKSPSLTVHPVPVERQQVERTKRVVERVWRAIEAGHFYPAFTDAVSDLSFPSAVPEVGCLSRKTSLG